MQIIQNRRFDEERALYALRDARVERCAFEGEADGESALKESSGVEAADCRFALRYPLWHASRFTVTGSRFTDTCRAAVWYAKEGEIADCQVDGVKFLRECDGIRIGGCGIVSPEFGWRCRGLTVRDSSVESEYMLFGSSGVRLERVRTKGKYSFQYTEDLTADGCFFDTKDAFWHTKNAVVRDCVVNGEYLGWYSDGLTLINCRISGTQPFCYCRNLKLIGCELENADLAFEYSDVEADLKGSVVSVKNPRSGRITADSIGEIILRDAVMDCACEIRIR